LNRQFSKCYATELAEGDEMINAVWKRIRSQLKLTLGTSGLDSIPRVKPSELSELQRILDVEIPALRRQAAPVQFSFTGFEGVKKQQ
jgi:hypothetical protein